jgi:hypothetical protein
MNDPCVLIEGPKWADAKVYGNWLLAAAKAEALWKQALKDPVFAKKIERLLVCFMPDFSIGATIMLAHLTEEFVAFSLQLDSEEGDEFVMMAEMGFFALTGERYQMVIPKKLSVDVVKSAALKYARTEDAEYELHPEYLVVSMPKAKALRWQKRLLRMDANRRCVDRITLLNAAP